MLINWCSAHIIDSVHHLINLFCSYVGAAQNSRIMCYVDTRPSLNEDDEMDMDLNIALSFGILKNVLHYHVITSYHRMARFLIKWKNNICLDISGIMLPNGFLKFSKKLHELLSYINSSLCE